MYTHTTTITPFPVTPRIIIELDMTQDEANRLMKILRPAAHDEPMAIQVRNHLHAAGARDVIG